MKINNFNREIISYYYYLFFLTFFFLNRFGYKIQAMDINIRFVDKNVLIIKSKGWNSVG